jgi:hypothetical protein
MLPAVPLSCRMRAEALAGGRGDLCKQRNASLEGAKAAAEARKQAHAPDAASALTMLQQLAEEYFGKARKMVEDNTEVAILVAGVAVLGLASIGFVLHGAHNRR